MAQNTIRSRVFVGADNTVGLYVITRDPITRAEAPFPVNTATRAVATIMATPALVIDTNTPAGAAAIDYSDPDDEGLVVFSFGRVANLPGRGTYPLRFHVIDGSGKIWVLAHEDMPEARVEVQISNPFSGSL